MYTLKISAIKNITNKKVLQPLQKSQIEMQECKMC